MKQRVADALQKMKGRAASLPKNKQRAADGLQVAGAAVFVAAGATVSSTVGLYSAVVALVVAGVVVERS